MLSSPSSWSLPDVVQVGGEWGSRGKDSSQYTHAHAHTHTHLFVPSYKTASPLSFSLHFRSERYDYHTNDTRADTQEHKAIGCGSHVQFYFSNSAGITDKLILKEITKMEKWSLQQWLTTNSALGPVSVKTNADTPHTDQSQKTFFRCKVQKRSVSFSKCPETNGWCDDIKGCWGASINIGTTNTGEWPHSQENVSWWHYFILIMSNIISWECYRRIMKWNMW